MFILTAKFNKRRAIAAAVALALVLSVVVLVAGARDRANSASAQVGAVVRDNAERVAYLKKLGWAVEDVACDEQAVTIPREFSEVYKRYNEIQTAQGFDLTKYGGAEAVRYTYRITNHPVEDANAVADIIVYRNEIIAGDVQSAKLDGFMTGLAFPK
ncbi:MAG: DUF4830 domain-containing protein [Oscillospiraceae bacterium]|jgi:hypothetical protein|nr:DUF4830 domain-containing protein [Oscillospiraceae bacterium]